jgi:rRNA maturation endonuclease Nob1
MVNLAVTVDLNLKMTRRWSKMTCWICKKKFKPSDRTSACGGESYHSDHDNEPETEKIPKTWAYFYAHKKVEK